MTKKHITFKEYNKKMEKVMKSKKFKSLPIEKQLIELLEEAFKYEIKGNKIDN